MLIGHSDIWITRKKLLDLLEGTYKVMENHISTLEGKSKYKILKRNIQYELS